MVVVVCASGVLGLAGYLWLAQYTDEVALQRWLPLWSVMAAGLAGGVASALWHPRDWGSLVLICMSPLFVALVVIDVAEHRLPDRMTGSAALLAAVGLSLATLGGGDGSQLRRAGIGVFLLGGGYLVLALCGGGTGMGLGDVKLAPSLGALTAWFSWDIWASGVALTFLLGGLWGVALLVRGHGLKARMPFGPFMVAGAVIALISA